MLNKELLLKRLSLIKHLYKIGLEQSFQSESVSAFSILAFHDSIDMFLDLALENIGIKKKEKEKIYLLDYWDKIPSLTLRESIGKLNERRINLKHKGFIPGRIEIEASRINTTEFFEQNTGAQFGVEFRDISLINLVLFSSVKRHLEKAQQLLNQNKLDESLENSAYAFEELLYSYENNKTDYYRKSPFFFGESIRRPHHNSNSIVGGDRELREYLRILSESVNALQEATKIISLQIDYKKFSKFKFLVPKVYRHFNNKITTSDLGNDSKLSIENCQFCIDFVIDCALRLQEFDFDIKHLIESEDEDFSESDLKDTKN